MMYAKQFCKTIHTKKEHAHMSYLGENIRKLGFGLMRLPMLDSEVDIEQTKQMVDMFMEAGFTYFDTAYGYLGGKSEMAVKTALVERYPRESFQLATKLPAWAGPKTAEEARQMFYTSLERTGAGYFDFYLLHNLGNDRTHFFDDWKLWDFALDLKKQGLIKHLGFSMHDSAEALEAILTAHPEAEFVQLQINYADWESDSVQSRACYEVARKHGKPIIIMEPVKGGNLATLPESVAEVFTKANPGVSQSSWAMRYAASLDGLITVLSGMSNIEQMEDNLKTMRDFQPLTDAERGVIAEAVARMIAIERIPCTACQYCVKDCPQQINIPGAFKAMNSLLVYGNQKSAKGSYKYATREGGKAADCIGCGQCESACPQHIDVIEQLKRCSEAFDE